MLTIAWREIGGPPVAASTAAVRYRHQPHTRSYPSRTRRQRSTSQLADGDGVRCEIVHRLDRL